jgi:hypothetical protein
VMSSARPKTIGARRKDLAATVKAVRDSNVGRLRTTADLIFVYDVPLNLCAVISSQASLYS